jgi:hypothetical protein
VRVEAEYPINSMTSEQRLAQVLDIMAKTRVLLDASPDDVMGPDCVLQLLSAHHLLTLNRRWYSLVRDEVRHVGSNLGFCRGTGF